ncbi:MAG TPA: serine hydrolase [Thermoanaerobaculia bacterium]|jgi:hypothetical protein|nr:serine hydrolase [Thermoanaerobaculia bacterium]
MRFYRALLRLYPSAFRAEYCDELCFAFSERTRELVGPIAALQIILAAIQAGAPLKLSTPVYQAMNGGVFPADLEPRKRAMTLEHLLTMSSGYFCDDSNPDAPGSEEIMINQDDEPDYYRFTLRVPMASAPGEKAVYAAATRTSPLESSAAQPGNSR